MSESPAWTNQLARFGALIQSVAEPVVVPKGRVQKRARSSSGTSGKPKQYFLPSANQGRVLKAAECVYQSMEQAGLREGLFEIGRAHV